MARQPYIPLYIGDWEQDVNGLSIEAEGAWLRIIFKCWRNEGSFTAPIDIIARVCKVDVPKMKSIIAEWKMNNICNIQELSDGMIVFTSRRIEREKKISTIRSEAGSSGGKASRNTRTKKLYDSPGFLYLVKDDEKHGEYKVGISKDPDKRLAGIRRSYKRDKVSIVFKWPVPDMGNYEDSILEYYKDVRDGEWIYMDVSPEYLRNEISSLVQKQTNSKTKPKEHQFTDIEYEYDNEVDNEVVIEKKGVQGKTYEILSDESLNKIFDAGYLDPLPLAYKGIDIKQELERFKIKIRGAPEDYGKRDSGGIRNAFLSHLKSAKPTNNAQTKGTSRTTSALTSGKDYSERL
jgi:uncharacterized protein YdaU (DUF1376 family)